jgi:hypothetical protein
MPTGSERLSARDHNHPWSPPAEAAAIEFDLAALQPRIASGKRGPDAPRFSSRPRRADFNSMRSATAGLILRTWVSELHARVLRP